MIVSECGWMRAKVPLLVLSLSPLLLVANQKNRCGNSHKLYCVSFHVCIEFRVFWWQVTLLFHHLILKLERKGMEGWIANSRGFWKFPFYGTWVFLRIVLFSCVFVILVKISLPSHTSGGLKHAPPSFRCGLERMGWRMTWFTLSGLKELNIAIFVKSR